MKIHNSLMTDFLFRLTMILSFILLLCLVFIFREHDQAVINGKLDAQREWIVTHELSLADLQALPREPCNINVLVVQPRREP